MDDGLPERTFAVAFEVEDETLRRALTAALPSRPALRTAARDDDRPDVIVTDHGDALDEDAGLPILIVGAETASASGPSRAVLPSADADLILSAAHLLAAGHWVIASENAERNNGGGRRGATVQGQLSARERQVLGLLVEGASNKDIARRLAISVHTAKFHVTAVLEKLGARNRSDAVAIGLRDGHIAL